VCDPKHPCSEVSKLGTAQLTLKLLVDSVEFRDRISKPNELLHCAPKFN